MYFYSSNQSEYWASLFIEWGRVSFSCLNSITYYKIKTLPLQARSARGWACQHSVMGGGGLMVPQPPWEFTQLECDKGGDFVLVMQPPVRDPALVRDPKETHQVAHTDTSLDGECLVGSRVEELHDHSWDAACACADIRKEPETRYNSYMQ